MSFKRFHSLRQTAAIRDLHAEVKLDKSNFIYPYFVVEGQGIILQYYLFLQTLTSAMLC